MSTTQLRRFAQRSVVPMLLAIVFVAFTTSSATAVSANHVGLAPAVSANVDLLGRAVALPDYYGPKVRLQPTATQLHLVRALGAHVAWNKYGTPQSLIHYGSWLSSGLHGSPVKVARSWVLAHRVLFRLTPAAVRGLTVVNDSKLVYSTSHVVLFRQSFGGRAAGQDGLITVGVRGSRVYYVSSSAAGMQQLTNHVVLSPAEAWVKAAANVGRDVSIGDVTLQKGLNGWTRLSVPGFAQVQQLRLRAFPTVNSGARAAYETIVEDVSGGQAMAYTVYVDAETGAILYRHNAVDQFSNLGTPAAGPTNGTFSGSYTEKACGTPQPLPTDSTAKSIIVVANADNPANDIALNLLNPQGQVVASSDQATSPEAVNYTFPSAPPTSPPYYKAQVCPSAAPIGPFLPPLTYTGVYQTSDQSTPKVTTIVPEWNFFLNNPLLDYSSKDVRATGCWEIPATSNGDAPQHKCQVRLNNIASRSPWDWDPTTNTPTFGSEGNNAQTRQAWASPLTPGPDPSGPIQPTDADRTYGWDDTTFTPPSEVWTNSWNVNKCDPTAIQNPAANNADVLPAIINLYAGHNRMHDWSYFLGFTEQNYNMQESNYGNTSPGVYPAGHEADPEVGNVQAGAVDGGYPEYLGRDNANQIALNDGTPGITNQYLFQPLAGAFYSPCVDGDYDFSVFGHEYTHAISNRMIGGPDDGIAGEQGGAMGESWSDQDALEYLHEYDYFAKGQNPWALGPYVTGNNKTGIRNYSLDSDPLNYSDIGYDKTGPEVHADGEVWSGAAYAMRQAMIAKWNPEYPANVRWIQVDCANGKRAPVNCPGNRRWIQDVYDGFLLMPSAVSMLDARDAYLAADLMRYGPKPRKNNQLQLWHAFATHGFGIDAKTTDGNDAHPHAGFVSPLEKPGTLAFSVVAGGHVIKDATIYVGRYEARVSPVADTDPKTKLGDTVRFAPGRYELVVQSPETGLHRVTVVARGGRFAETTIRTQANWASLANGAVADGNGAKKCEASTVPAPCGLIDNTEATNWSFTTSGDNVNKAHPSVTVTLSHPQVIGWVTASALPDPSEGRFGAVRQFQLQACVSECGGSGAKFRTVFTSSKAAFPSTLPRPVAPDLIFRSFKAHPFKALAVRLVVLNNQCTGAPAYQDPNNKLSNDPTSPADCTTGSTAGQSVNVSELELFSPGSGKTIVRYRYR
jgi:hypothetical protein